LQMGRGVSQTVCLGWPQTTSLPVSASQVARITGVSPWHLAQAHILCFLLSPRHLGLTNFLLGVLVLTTAG
jgi:hypothetical protein